MRKAVLIAFIGLVLASTGRSQGGNVADSSIFTPLISASYGIQLPGGDLQERFGFNHSIGTSFNFKLPSQWLLGAEYNFIFGNQVKDRDILDALRTETGTIINSAGQPSSILVFERGHIAMANFGRNFPVFGPNPNSGMLIKIGVGYMQHKIRIEHNNDNIPALEDDYKKGYDRLTGGLLTHQFIGYQYLSNKKVTNFIFGFEFYQGFTQNLRTYDIPTRSYNTGESRVDLLYGIRIGWILPVYKRAPQDFYTN